MASPGRGALAFRWLFFPFTLGSSLWLAHERDFFWRFHSVHHSPARIYWLNAGRDHPLGMLLDYSAGALPLTARA